MRTDISPTADACRACRSSFMISGAAYWLVPMTPGVRRSSFGAPDAARGEHDVRYSCDDKMKRIVGQRTFAPSCASLQTGMTGEPCCSSKHSLAWSEDGASGQ